MTPSEVDLLYQTVLEKEQVTRDLVDYAQGHVAWILAEINRDRKHRMAPFRLDEFLLFSRPGPGARNGHAAPQTEEAVKAQQQAWLSMFKMEEAKAQQHGMSFFTISTNEDA